MSQSKILQECNWEHTYEDSEIYSQPIPDEVISIYEVYVKEDCADQNGSSVVPFPPGNSSETNHPNIQDEITDLELMDVDILDMNENNENITKIYDKNFDRPVLRKKKMSGTIIRQQNETSVSQTAANTSISSTTRRHIDKDDPRSRLHFVKYLKRDGKTFKLWECGICSKEFRHQYTLMRHLPTHTDERNFKCDVCGKAFRQLSTLSQHKAIHSDARPYVCEYCTKTFNRVSTLISHRKTHSENKPHKCHMCGKGFHQKGNLRNHVFTHTNERPYKCELCGKGFNQMSNLVCHKVKAHAHVEQMQYSCALCGREFPRRFALRSHEEFKHGIKYRSTRRSGSQSSGVKDIVQLNEYNEEFEDARISPYAKNILIDKIQYKAMDEARRRGQVPLVLYRPVKGYPIIVKVMPAGPNQDLLILAIREDIKLIYKTYPFSSETGKNGHYNVLIVATVIQSIGSNGKSSYNIESFDSNQDQVKLFSKIENLSLPLEDPQFYKLGTSDLGESEHHSEPSSSSSIDGCNELLELAEQGGIQFVRATDDGRYEVMSNSDARNLMAQNSHDVTILDGVEAEAINLMNSPINLNENVMITDNDNQIMVLDSENQKPIPPLDEEIEILEEKDIRILEVKNLDDRFVDNMSFFSTSKMDDILASGKSIAFDSGIPPIVAINDDVPSTRQDILTILDHHNDMPIPPSSQACMQPGLTKNESSLSLINETLSYIKSSRGLLDDFNILSVDGICIEDTNSVNVYDPKIKLTDFDDIMTDPNSFMSMNRDAHLLNDRGQTSRIYSNNEKVTLPTFEDMKSLGPKYQEFEAASNFHDIKIFGSYDQYLKSANGCRPDSIMHDQTLNNEFKMLGKKNEPRYHDGLQEELLAKVPSLLKQNPSTSSSTITIIDYTEFDGAKNMDKVTDNFVHLQASTLCESSVPLSIQPRSSESPERNETQVSIPGDHADP